MDMKFKIIILVFVVIALIYAVHFVITQVNTKKKTEKFIVPDDDDDVEKYEDPVAKVDTYSESKNDSKTDSKSESKSDVEKKYDTRVLILNDIEKLDINDKNIKGKLMEYLFSSETISKISSLSDNERSIFIQSKYDLIKTGSKLDVSSETTVKKEKAEFSSNTNSQPAPVAPPKPNKIPSDIYDGLPDTYRDILKKTEDAMENLKKTELNIQQMQDTIKSKAIYVDKLPEGYREPDIPEPKIEGFQDKISISGFENVRNYASLF